MFKGTGKIFKGKTQFWDFRLGDRIKARLFEGISTQHIPFVESEEGTLLFHFLGPLQGFLWEKALSQKGFDAQDFSGKAMAIKGPPLKPEEIAVSRQDLRPAIKESMGVLRKFLSLGAFYPYLPPV